MKTTTYTRNKLIVLKKNSSALKIQIFISQKMDQNLKKNRQISLHVFRVYLARKYRRMSLEFVLYFHIFFNIAIIWLNVLTVEIDEI